MASVSPFPSYHNENLFSNYYLEKHLQRESFWTTITENELDSFWSFIHTLFSKEQTELAKYNETTLEEKWIRPILDKLGHIYLIKHPIKALGEEQIRSPDYVFFNTEENQKNTLRDHDAGERTGTYAVGEAKSWDKKLDANDKNTDPFESRSPHYQITYYLRTTSTQWGILTNGKLWRLYLGDFGFKKVYYEVNLESILRRNIKQNMLYFLVFFRQASFIPYGAQPSILEKIKTGSETYAIKIQQEIKKQAYEALRNLCQGFLDSWSEPSKKPGLTEIQRNGLILLYRLLFIFYAESHHILPVSDTQYFEKYSLHKLRLEIREKGIKRASRTSLYWSRLTALFAIISDTQETSNLALNIPRFKEGLFSPKYQTFFEKHEIGNSSLIEAIKRLSQNLGTPEKELYDYSSLEITHLGSIYEGLLDYRIRYEQEAYVGVKRNKLPVWIPKSEVQPWERISEEVPPKTIFLEAGQGERKSSGSFYTPSEIVKHMSYTCLEPIFDHFREEAIQNLQFDPKRYIELILHLKILDPAMGSGHFLLGIAEYIANELMRVQVTLPVESEEDNFLRYVKTVIENTIYGVDLNALAVDLAKDALWFEIAFLNESLSLIEQRIKWGNALTGIITANNFPFERITGYDTEGIIHPFDWNLEFPLIFQGKDPGFDLIIGNPPYINAINMKMRMPEVRDYLKENYKFLSEKWDIYIAFIERCLCLLRKGGVLSFIVPDAFLSEKYAKPIREYIQNSFRILQIDYFSDVIIFERVGIHNIILTLQKEPPKLPIRKILYRDLKGSVEIKEVLDYERIFTEFFDETITLDESKFYTLDDIAYISTGIVFNAKEPEYKGQFKKKDLISLTPTKNHTRKLLEGDKVFPYEIRGHCYVEWGTERVPRNIRRPTFSELHQSHKLVTNKLGAFKVAYDDEGYLCDQTVRVIIKWQQIQGITNDSIKKTLSKARYSREDLELISRGFDYYVLLALLNSKIYRFLFYKKRTSHSMDINPDVLRKIAIPEINSDDQSEIKRLTREIIDLSKKISKIRQDFVSSLSLEFKIKNSTKIMDWDNLDWGIFLNELHRLSRKSQKQFNQFNPKIIPKPLSLSQKSEWNTHFKRQKAAIRLAEEEIQIRIQQLDTQFYALYGLTATQVQTIENYFSQGY
ncbi:MAG: hypothetical protein RBG13Loki_0298 [Promethearchaeota archaeon CR_4]|nr:MAG: hypothetical protein RBG13Loki_0298 [Candidatus Lokiarchaeota archaeon CR_4]